MKTIVLGLFAAVMSTLLGAGFWIALDRVLEPLRQITR